MPTYRFKSKKTGKEWDDEMSHTKLDAYYKEYDGDIDVGFYKFIPRIYLRIPFQSPLYKEQNPPVNMQHARNNRINADRHGK